MLFFIGKLRIRSNLTIVQNQFKILNTYFMTVQLLNIVWNQCKDHFSQLADGLEWTFDNIFCTI